MCLDNIILKRKTCLYFGPTKYGGRQIGALLGWFLKIQQGSSFFVSTPWRFHYHYLNEIKALSSLHELSFSHIPQATNGMEVVFDSRMVPICISFLCLSNFYTY